MKVNTLHVVVPAWCSNNCLFCVSKMHDVVCNPQPIAIDKIKEKLILAIRKGVSTLVFSSYGEPFLNVPWMEVLFGIVPRFFGMHDWRCLVIPFRVNSEPHNLHVDFGA